MQYKDFITKAPRTNQFSRRAMLRAAGCGFGMVGLQSVLAQAAAAHESFNGRFYQYDGTALDW